MLKPLPSRSTEDVFVGALGRAPRNTPRPWRGLSALRQRFEQVGLSTEWPTLMTILADGAQSRWHGRSASLDLAVSVGRLGAKAPMGLVAVRPWFSQSAWGC